MHDELLQPAKATKKARLQAQLLRSGHSNTKERQGKGISLVGYRTVACCSGSLKQA